LCRLAYRRSVPNNQGERRITMALSREEQRILDQLEAALASQEKELLDKGLQRLKIAFIGGLFFAALALLVLGASTKPILSVLGYALLVTASLTLLHAIATSSAFDRYANRPDMATPARFW
jgi:hypothetical protein